jgi:hypothetical protein
VGCTFALERSSWLQNAEVLDADLDAERRPSGQCRKRIALALLSRSRSSAGGTRQRVEP